MKFCSPFARIYRELAVLYHQAQTNQEQTMATLADVLKAEADAKAEMDTISVGVTALVASNKDLADKLAAAIAANDPAQLQAALDAANALVTEGQAVVAQLPTPAPAT